MNRTELDTLSRSGYSWNSPFEIVDIFEKKIAEFTGSKYGVATDSCTHAIELCLRFLNFKGSLEIPKRTYPSVPMTALKLGVGIHWSDEEWEGSYIIKPTPIHDASLLFKRNMYIPHSFQCLSFHVKKNIPIGRGGMILTDNLDAYYWLKRAAYDGRDLSKMWKEDPISQLGYHYYMPPEDAARGIILFDKFSEPSVSGGSSDYPDISQWPVFQLK